MKKKLIQSIKIKLDIYASLREKSKLEALNEALDRALSVHRGQMALKAASLNILALKNDNEVQSFLKKYKEVG